MLERIRAEDCAFFRKTSITCEIFKLNHACSRLHTLKLLAIGLADEVYPPLLTQARLKHFSSTSQARCCSVTEVRTSGRLANKTLTSRSRLIRRSADSIDAIPQHAGRFDVACAGHTLQHSNQAAEHADSRTCKVLVRGTDLTNSLFALLSVPRNHLSFSKYIQSV